MTSARVLILKGEFAGCEGVCVGEQSADGSWPIYPDNNDTILALRCEREFGLLVDLSTDLDRNQITCIIQPSGSSEAGT
jgi:hypothetical protein